ncbi:MAG: hypothetical protein LBL52_02070 [Rickettsiales bacterium]|nr:hypothetical protein [Rickettsiales bacterium]
MLLIFAIVLLPFIWPYITIRHIKVKIKDKKLRIVNSMKAGPVGLATALEYEFEAEGCCRLHSYASPFFLKTQSKAKEIYDALKPGKTYTLKTSGLLRPNIIKIEK